MKRPIVVCCIVAILFAVGLFLDYVLVPVLSPYATAKVPQSCIDRDGSTHPVVPIIVASDARAKLLLIGDTLQLVRKSDNAVLRTLQFPDDVVAATFHDGVAYIFNDAIGYFIDESTGAPVDNLLETDNYRENSSTGGTMYVQTDVELSAIRPSRGLLSHLHLDFHTYAYGCRLH